MTQAQTMRLQKYMSMKGICSRRKAEEYIQNGEVFVNGKKAELGMSVIEGVDTVELWKTAIVSQQNLVYYKMYKPRWIETTCAQRWWKSLLDIVDIPERVFPIGRLDKDSTGLILLTNDGRLTNYLTHPRYEHEKEYRVETFGPISDEALRHMSRWVYILWRWTKKCKITRIASWKFSIILKEWRNRQIRRMVEAVWWKVKRLHRTRIGNIFIENLESGVYQKLSYKEEVSLQELIHKLSQRFLKEPLRNENFPIHSGSIEPSLLCKRREKRSFSELP